MQLAIAERTTVDLKLPNGDWAEKAGRIIAPASRGCYRVLRFETGTEWVIPEETVRPSSCLVRMSDAGSRERQFAFGLWQQMKPLEADALPMPFWKFMEMMQYDPVKDELVFGFLRTQVGPIEDKSVDSERAITQATVMATIRDLLTEIAHNSSYNPQFARDVRKNLYEVVLKAIARGDVSDPKELALAALKAEDIKLRG